MKSLLSPLAALLLTTSLPNLTTAKHIMIPSTSFNS